ncbi:hypothetical protein AWB67_06308 [Caballeronia terrestris]|uniref:Uncharacterized protein n=1 Tax=Caballeronia terrestris TaxID=1226301 RepID=A0A158KR73_9BURK|nr:hypothetical protein AWB67_06308 [Caballeronia terrestris]
MKRRGSKRFAVAFLFISVVLSLSAYSSTVPMPVITQTSAPESDPKALGVAPGHGWVVVDMKSDWDRNFPTE